MTAAHRPGERRLTDEVLRELKERLRRRPPSRGLIGSITIRDLYATGEYDLRDLQRLFAGRIWVCAILDEGE